MFVCGPGSQSVCAQCICDNACTVSVPWAAEGGWDVRLGCQRCSSFVFCSGGPATEEETCQSAFLTEPLPSFICLCISLLQWTFLFWGVPAAQSLALDDVTDRMCSTYKPVSCLGLVYFWLWNVELGNRELHWEHLVPALSQAERGVWCGQRNVKYIVGVWPVQSCLWGNSQLSFLGNGRCSWNPMNEKVPKWNCFKPKMLGLP